MRRGWALAVVMAVVVVGAACQADPQPQASAPPMVSPTVEPTDVTPRQPGSASVTRQACVDGTKAVTGGLTVFNTQIAVLETAAKKNDQQAMVVAATSITTTLTKVAATLNTLAQKDVTPPVRATLTNAATALTEMGSGSYTGSLADQRKKLAELATAMTKACS